MVHHHNSSSLKSKHAQERAHNTPDLVVSSVVQHMRAKAARGQQISGLFYAMRIDHALKTNSALLLLSLIQYYQVERYRAGDAYHSLSVSCGMPPGEPKI